VSVKDELIKLGELRDRGALTQEEFDKQRLVLLTRSADAIDAAARERGPTSARDLRHEHIGLVLFAGMIIAFFSGVIVVVMAFLWQGRELSQWSILFAWPVAAVVLCATFAPLAFLASRRAGPPIVLAPGERPPASRPSNPISEAAEQAPFWLAVGATVLAILFWWTSIVSD
jgi:hypothetical protein